MTGGWLCDGVDFLGGSRGGGGLSEMKGSGEGVEPAGEARDDVVDDVDSKGGGVGDIDEEVISVAVQQIL